MSMNNFQGAHFQEPRFSEKVEQPTSFDEKKAHFTKIVESLETDNKLSEEELRQIEELTKEQNARLKEARGYFLTGTLDGDVDDTEVITNYKVEDFNKLLVKTYIPVLDEENELTKYIVDLDFKVDKILKQGSKKLKDVVAELRALMGELVKELDAKKQEPQEGVKLDTDTNEAKPRMIRIDDYGNAVYEDNIAKIRDEALSLLKQHELLQKIILIDMILTKTTTADITEIFSKENVTDFFHIIAKQTQLLKKTVLLRGKDFTKRVREQIDKLRIKIASGVVKSFGEVKTALSNSIDRVKVTCNAKLLAFDKAIRAIIKDIIEKSKNNRQNIAIQCHNLTNFDSQQVTNALDTIGSQGQPSLINTIRANALENNICKIIFQCSEWSSEQSPEKFNVVILKRLLIRNTTEEEKVACFEEYDKLLDEFNASTAQDDDQYQSIKALTSYVLDKVYVSKRLGVNRIGCVDLLKDVRLVIDELTALAEGDENADFQKLITHLKEQSYNFVTLRAQDTELNNSYFCEIEKDDDIESSKKIDAVNEPIKLAYVDNFKAYVAGKKTQYKGVLNSSIAYTTSSDIAAIKQSWCDTVYFFNLNGREFSRKLYSTIEASDFLTTICRTDTLTNKVETLIRYIKLGKSNVGASLNTFISENLFKSQSYNNYDFTTPANIDTSIDMYEKYVNLLAKVVGRCDRVSGDELEVSKVIQYVIERKGALPRMVKGATPELTTTTNRKLKSFIENVLSELTEPSTFAPRHIDFLDLTTKGDDPSDDSASTEPGQSNDSDRDHSSDDDTATNDSANNALANEGSANNNSSNDGLANEGSANNDSSNVTVPTRHIVEPSIEECQDYWLKKQRGEHTLDETTSILNSESKQLSDYGANILNKIHKNLVDLKEETKYGLLEDEHSFKRGVHFTFATWNGLPFEDKYEPQTQMRGGGILEFFGISSKETILDDINTMAEKKVRGVTQQGNDTLVSKSVAVKDAVGAFLAPLDLELKNNVINSNSFTLANLTDKCQTFKSEAMDVIYQDYLIFVRQRMLEPLMALKRMVAVHVITLSAFKLLQKVKLPNNFNLNQELAVQVREIGRELITELAITDKTTYDSLLKPGAPLADLINYITNGISDRNSIEEQKALYDKLTKWLFYLSRTHKAPSVFDALRNAASLDKSNLSMLLEQLHIHIDNKVGVNNITRTNGARASEDIELVGSRDYTSAKYATVTVVDMISKTLALLTADQVESADGKFRIEKFSSNVIYQKFQDTLSSVSSIVSMYGGMNLAARRLNGLAKVTFLVREQLISQNMIDQILTLDSIHRTTMKRNDVSGNDKQVLQTRFDEAIKIMNEPMSVILKLYGGLHKLTPQGLPNILTALYDMIFDNPLQSINAMFHYGTRNKSNLREQMSDPANRMKTFAKNRQINGTTLKNIQYNLEELQRADARLVDILSIFNKIIAIKYVGEPDKNTAIETLFTELEIYDRTSAEKESLIDRFRVSKKTFLAQVDGINSRSDVNTQNNNVKGLVQKVLGELGLNKQLDINVLINTNIKRSDNLKKTILNEKSLKDNIKGDYLAMIKGIDMDTQGTQFLSAELVNSLNAMQNPVERDATMLKLVNTLKDTLDKIYDLTALDNAYRHLVATKTQGTLIKYNNPDIQDGVLADNRFVIGGNPYINEVEEIVRNIANKLPNSKFSDKDIKAIAYKTNTELKNAESSPLKRDNNTANTDNDVNIKLSKFKNYKSNLADKIKTALTRPTRDQGLNFAPQVPAYNSQSERVRGTYQPERVDDRRTVINEAQYQDQDQGQEQGQDQGSVLTQSIVLVSLGVSCLAAVGFALFN